MIFLLFLADAGWKDNLVGLAETLRLSYGAGIVLRLGGIARLEVNYCVPVRTQKGDRQGSNARNNLTRLNYLFVYIKCICM